MPSTALQELMQKAQQNHAKNVTQRAKPVLLQTPLIAAILAHQDFITTLLLLHVLKSVLMDFSKSQMLVLQRMVELVMNVLDALHVT